MPSAANLLADDYYVVLGITKDASDADIAKAYKKLALKHHPDKNPDRKEEAEEEFKKLTEAYDVLRCPEKRKIYDDFGKEGMNGHNPQSGESDFGGQQANMSREEADEIFKAFFGGGDPFGNMFRQEQGGTSQFVFRTGGLNAEEGPSGFTSFGSPFAGLGFGGMRVGGFQQTGRRSSAFGSRTGQATARNRSRTVNSRPHRGSGRHVVPCGTPVVVHSLTKSIHYNGNTGHISDWDASKGRYEVTLRLGDENMWVGDNRLWLRPQNITQLCSIEVVGLVNKPELNGTKGRITGYDALKHRYTILANDGATLSLQPSNCIASSGTCVVVNGLCKSECNGQQARILSNDLAACRYTVECENGKQIKIKYGNVLC
jgi:curved DNA-binding protein CbpA